MPLWIQIFIALVGAIAALAGPVVAVAALRASTRLSEQQLQITRAQNRINLQWQLCADLYRRLDKASDWIFDGQRGLTDGGWQTWWDEDEYPALYADIKHLELIAGDEVTSNAWKVLSELNKVTTNGLSDPEDPESVWGAFNASLRGLRDAIRADLWDERPSDTPALAQAQTSGQNQLPSV